MPRYTKQDKNGKYYIESVNGKLESNIKGHNYGEAIDRFAELENADVVPRSEVEELEKKLNDYKKFVGEIRVTSENHAVIIDTEHTEYIDKRVAEGLKNMAVHKAKQEVAKQIFEDIENLMDKKFTINHGVVLVSKYDFSELKKKYIGE